MSEQANQIKTIAIVGGTGKEGRGLAYRWIKAGYQVFIGSRQAEKAEAAAADLRELTGADAEVSGMDNYEAARQADIVVITVPFSAHRSTLELIKPSLVGKILIDVTVPLVPPRVTKVQMPPAGSAAQEALEIVGDQTQQVAAAFQNLSYEHLLRDEEIGCDILVTGSSKIARMMTLELVEAAGLVGYDAGPIENSVVIEGLTSILIGINKQFGIQSAGIRITGVPLTKK